MTPIVVDASALAAIAFAEVTNDSRVVAVSRTAFAVEHGM
jgi:hypothetical protein